MAECFDRYFAAQWIEISYDVSDLQTSAPGPWYSLPIKDDTNFPDVMETRS